MNAFLIGLIFLIVAVFFAGVGLFLLPVLFIFGWFLNLVLLFGFAIFAIWLLGKFIIFFWDNFVNK
jgi:hypothetical protein